MVSDAVLRGLDVVARTAQNLQIANHIITTAAQRNDMILFKIVLLQFLTAHVAAALLPSPQHLRHLNCPLSAASHDRSNWKTL